MHDLLRALTLGAAAEPPAGFAARDFTLRQELVNAAPLGPGAPVAGAECPTGPGRWIPGGGRSTGTSDLFGDLTQTEVYCIDAERAQLTRGSATWTDADGDEIAMTFLASLLAGPVYAEAPSAPIVGHARLMGGAGKWTGISGAAFIAGRQNGDGAATLEYRGVAYLPVAP